jgi:hypothetical protein
MLNQYRNNTISTVLPVLFVFLFGANVAFAAHHDDHGLSYRTQLHQDLDGDHIPETATIRLCDHLYQVNIHFTTGRPKLRLTSYIGQGVAGITVQMTDVNDDGKDEIVVLSATSIRPLAIWQNQGKAKFQKVSSWSFGIERHTGPGYRHRQTFQPEPVGNILFDPLLNATLDSAYLHAGADLVGRVCSEPNIIAADFIDALIPARSPPAAARV